MNFYIINVTLTLDENIALHEKQAKLEKKLQKSKSRREQKNNQKRNLNWCKK